MSRATGTRPATCPRTGDEQMKSLDPVLGTLQRSTALWRDRDIWESSRMRLEAESRLSRLKLVPRAFAGCAISKISFGSDFVLRDGERRNPTLHIISHQLNFTTSYTSSGAKMSSLNFSAVWSSFFPHRR